jgi:hypothetical protein
MIWPRRGSDGVLPRVGAALTVAMLLGVGLTSVPNRAFAFTTDPSGSPGAVTATQTAALSPWDGSVNLYRTGVFATQKTWYYCTAAAVQIMRNIVYHEERHGRTAQDRYFAYMRDHLRYQIPVRHGIDPAGWTAGLRHFVDDRYRLVRSSTFGSLLRSAVRSLRRTNLPVALFVDHGNHGWVLHGFTATADPATTSDFTVTSVRVSGPLWGRQNATYGYDMRPNKKLTRAQLKDFVTRWHYGPIRMVYEGEFLSIQPVGSAAAVAASSEPSPTDQATSQATPIPTPPQSPPSGETAGPSSDQSTTPALAPAAPTAEATPTAAAALAGSVDTRPSGGDPARGACGDRASSIARPAVRRRFAPVSHG